MDENNQTSNEESLSSTEKAAPSTLRRFTKYLMGVGVVLLIAILSLPWFAATLLCETTAETWISDKLNGNIKIGDASVGWQSPIMLNDVTYSDEAGKELVNVKAVTSNQSLWDLIRRPQRPIELELEGIRASLTVPHLKPRDTTGETIDLNIVINEIMKHQISRAERDMKVTVVDSQLELTNPAGQSLIKWQPVTATYQAKAGTNPTQTLEVDAPIARVTSQANQKQVPQQGMKIAASWKGSTSSNSISKESLNLKVTCTEQPLTMLQPLLESQFPEMLPTEPMTGELTGLVERIGQEQLLLKFNTVSTEYRSESQQPSSAMTLPLRLDAEASYSREEDEIQVSQLFAQIDETSLTAQGKVTEISGKQVVDATATFKSPAETISDLLPEELKQNVTFDNIQMSELSMKGPLRPDPAKPFHFVFELSTNVSWANATAYGLHSQNGKVKLLLRGQELELIPVSLPINNGHVRKLPKLNLATKPMTVTVEKGVMLDRINLTEQLCSDWLQYVSPLLSDATRPSGTFSLIPEAATFQLGKIAEANLSGKMHIHQAQVRSGPLTSELLNLVAATNLIKNQRFNPDDLLLMRLNEQTIDYQLVDGRVYHDGFHFNVADFVFSSNGSVGLDETLDVLVTMNFPDDIQNKGPILQSITSQPLQFHITGTLDKPKIKGEELKEMGKRIGIQAAEGLLQKILENRARKGPKKRRDR